MHKHRLTIGFLLDRTQEDENDAAARNIKTHNSLGASDFPLKISY